MKQFIQSKAVLQISLSRADSVEVSKPFEIPSTPRESAKNGKVSPSPEESAVEATLNGINS
jgi:hypothetical protein